MAGAYVIIRALPGAEKQVIEQVTEIPNVISAEGVYGDFDIVVRIEVPGNESLQPVLSKIRGVAGVRLTNTAFTVEGERRSGTGTDHLGAPSD
ncbi:Lrp/AsnC ligand binding domain-containing protein [Candidatus Nitrososphaera sp. FF02]|uniref:Lrp/AsnC ligand binding domain-containing protein n=1 Tax=Candidatus Nitrososphaera sp. FF02 TaxID=3398226 RepID=UPI0039E8934A